MAQIVDVLSRSTAHPEISMWGTLHADRLTGAFVGWIVDTWNEGNFSTHLRPKMHWVPKEDGKFYHVRLNLGTGRSAVEVFDEDTQIES